jgi:hypothetical protein
MRVTPRLSGQPGRGKPHQAGPHLGRHSTALCPPAVAAERPHAPPKPSPRDGSLDVARPAGDTRSTRTGVGSSSTTVECTNRGSHAKIAERKDITKHGSQPRRQISEQAPGAHEERRSRRPRLRSRDAAARQQFRASPLRARDASGTERTLDTFCVHSLGHYVGRDVNGTDTGFGVQEVLQEGRVIAIEPGLYIATEGIAIRAADLPVVRRAEAG